MRHPCSGRTAGKWSDCQYRDDRDRECIRCDGKAKGDVHYDRGAGDDRGRCRIPQGYFFGAGKDHAESSAGKEIEKNLKKGLEVPAVFIFQYFIINCQTYMVKSHGSNLTNVFLLNKCIVMFCVMHTLR